MVRATGSIAITCCNSFSCYCKALVSWKRYFVGAVQEFHGCAILVAIGGISSDSVTHCFTWSIDLG